jgi:hypothetical protein
MQLGLLAAIGKDWREAVERVRICLVSSSCVTGTVVVVDDGQGGR